MKLKTVKEFIKLQQERGNFLSYEELINLIKSSEKIFYLINVRKPSPEEIIQQMIKDLKDEFPF